MTNQGNVEHERLSHTEPNYLLPSPKTQTAVAPSQNGTPTGNKVPPIWGKAITLGDYVDTGAVSDIVPLMGNRNTDLSLARSIEIPYICIDRRGFGR